MVVAESASQNNRFSFKLTVETHDKTEGVCIEAVLAQAGRTKTLELLLASFQVNPEIGSSTFLAHQTVQESVSRHRQTTVKRIYRCVEVLQRYGRSTAGGEDIRCGIKKLRLIRNGKFFFLKNVKCKTFFGFLDFAVGDSRNDQIGINSPYVRESCLNANLRRFIHKLKFPIDARTVLRQGNQFLACPTARPAVGIRVAGCVITFDDSVFTGILEVAKNQSRGRIYCNFGIFVVCGKCALSVGEDRGVNDGC